MFLPAGDGTITLQCKKFVEVLPTKLDHEITTNGGQFSRGQRVRLPVHCELLLRQADRGNTATAGPL
jgi:ABC-type transport system involved in cytochrome bd biosynthesis fused ATPase/permease subunit